MKDASQENPPRMGYFRYAVLSLTAFLVLSLGFALIPAEPPAPAEPPFSEQARTAALEQTLSLRSTGMALAASGGNTTAGGTPAAPLDRVVTLLTIQARALMLPAAASTEAAASATATASRPAGAAAPSATPPPSNFPAQATLAEFAAALAASGQQRLKDAETADGGMARLLAACGTAQLLAAEQLGAPAAPAPGGQSSEGQSPEGQERDKKPSRTEEVAAAGPGSTEPAGASACPVTPAAGSISVGAALAAAAEAELEAVYGYQAALTRLSPEGARPASDFLAQHQDLADQAGAYSLMHCGAQSPQPPGYVLDSGFLDAPAAGLARLETATLPAYGDIVAITGSTTRAWALSALQGAARRAQQWGAEANPLPGLVLDEAQLPQLPG